MITGHELHIQAKAAFEKETGIVYGSGTLEERREKIEARHNFVFGYLTGFESGVKELTTEGLAQIQVFK